MYPILTEPKTLKIQPKYTLVYTVSKGMIYPVSVNKTAGEILSLCDGQHNIDEIIEIMHKKYAEEFILVQKFVEEFIDNSIKIGILKKSYEKENNKICIIGNENHWTPDFIDIELTHGCMLNCRHCYLSADMKKTNVMINYDELSRLLYEMKEIGVSLVQITGGEPLLHPRIKDIINLLIELNMQFVIVTSGYYYNDEILACLSKIPSENGSRLQVSIDGLEEKHNILRGNKNAFSRTINFVKAMAKKNISIDIVATTSENEYERNEIIELCKLVKEYGVKRFRITTILELGRASENCLSSSESFNKTVLELASYLKENFEEQNFTVIYTDENQKKRTCGTGCTFFRVDPNMKIYPCPLSNDALGDLKKTKLIDYLNKDSKYSKIIAPCEKYCTGCENEYLCTGCISQGLINHEKVARCLWYENSGMCDSNK